MKRIALVMCLVFLVLLLPAAHAMALGVAIGPQTMEISSALRGGEYQQVVTVFNPSPAECSYRVGAEGDVATWISFYDWKTKEAVQRFTIPGESGTPIGVKVNVPPDIVNGSYSATIYAETAFDDNGTSGASTVLRSTAALTVKVSGIQTMEGTVGTITALDTEAGLPLRVLVNFQNTGNVAVKPKVDCQILKEGSQVATFSQDKITVRPSSQETISAEWVTTKEQAGTYTGKVTVSLGDKVVGTKEIPFKVLPPGTLTKQGEFVSLRFDGQPALDATIKVQSDFKSTGQADVLAKLIAEVSCNGALIDTIKSEETLVPVGQTSTLTSYLKLTKTGQYSVKAYVSYEGKQTGIKEIKLDVGGAPSAASPVASAPSVATSGEFMSLNFEGQPILNSMLKVRADFKSTSQADVQAKLIGEVYYNGNLVNTIQSEQTLVPPGQTSTLISYLKLDNSGQYTVKAYVSYQGKQTPSKEIKMDVGAQAGASAEKPAASGAGAASSLSPLLIVGMAAGALILVFIALLLWKRR